MKTNSNILKHSAIFFFFSVFFALVYWPIIQGHYLYGEDYWRIWTSGSMIATFESYDQYMRTLWVEGRPLQVLGYFLMFNKYINSLKSYEAINTVRMIGIFGVGLLAYVLYNIFKEYRFRTSHAFFLSILICTLPPIQIYLGRLVCLIYIYSALLTAFSFFILSKALFNENGSKTTHMLIAVTTSILLLSVSYSIYQPTATAYWALAVIPILFMKDEDFAKKWRLIFIIFSVGIASILMYWGSVKAYYWLVDVELHKRASYIGIVDVFPKIVWFIKYPIYTASNLWNIVPVKEFTVFVGIVIFTGVAYGLGRVIKQVISEKKGLTLLYNSLFRYSLVLILIPLSILGSLVSKGHGGVWALVPHQRVLVGLYIIIFILFYWGLRQIVELIKGAFKFSSDLQNQIVIFGLIVLTFFAVFYANRNVDKYFTQQHSDEYRLVKEVIQGYGVANLSKNTNIYVKWSDREKGSKMSLIYGGYYNIALPGNIIRLVLYELGIRYDINIIRIDTLGNKLPEDETPLIIDMSQMRVLQDRYR